MLFGALALAGMTLTAPAPAIQVEVVGTGRPMILIPGYLSSGEVWKTTVDRFKDRYQIHVVTVAGFAGAPATASPGLQNVRDAIIDYAVTKKLEKPVLVGHSMGGVLALWIAATTPDLPSAVVSVDGVPFLPALMNPAATAESAKPQAQQMKAIYASMTGTQLAAQTRMALGSMISAPADIEQATAWAAASDPATAGALIEDLMTTDIRGDMSRVTAPVLLIPALKAMSGDAAIMKNAVAAYERQVAPIRTHVTTPAHTLHFVMLDDPAFFLRTLEEFLATQTAKVK
jgi:N-formylmaleamate deformylase